LMELYSWIFETLDSIESKELLQQWLLAIKGEQPPLFHQDIKDWPPIKGEQVMIRIPLHFNCDWRFLDNQGILFYILCGTHGRNLDLGKLYVFMKTSSIHPATKVRLEMTITLRKRQLQRSRESPSEPLPSVWISRKAVKEDSNLTSLCSRFESTESVSLSRNFTFGLAHLQRLGACSTFLGGFTMSYSWQRRTSQTSGLGKPK
jgi:hypothetical protein